MTDIYAAPHAELRRASRADSWGSLERGIAGDYDFSIRAVLRESWEATAGAKLALNGALGIYGAILIAFAGLPFLLLTSGEQPPTFSWKIQIAQQLVSALIFGPLNGAMWMMGILRASGTPIRAGMVLGQFHKAVPLFLTELLMRLGIVVGMLLLIVPGIYLAVAYLLSSGLVVDKNLSPWQALETSRKAIGKRWFKVLGLGIALFAINFATIVTLFIGLIWTVPMSVIAGGILYRTIFGCDSATIGDGTTPARG